MYMQWLLFKINSIVSFSLMTRFVEQCSPPFYLQYHHQSLLQLRVVCTSYTLAIYYPAPSQEFFSALYCAVVLKWVFVEDAHV